MSFENILLLISLAVIGYLIMAYKRFISLREAINTSWSKIDSKLKRRYDLIPALLDSMKIDKEHEDETLENLIQARQQELTASSMNEKAAADNMMSKALGKIFALVETYPDLKANTGFIKLQDELSNIEDTIQSTRRYYNARVRNYNYRLESFPDRFIARKFHYTSRNYFELDASKQQM